MSNTELTPEEMKKVEKGEAAAAFLSHPVMASTINELSEVLSNLILNTNPDETEKRERLYNIHFALKELVFILNERVRTKDSILETANDSENE